MQQLYTENHVRENVHLLADKLGEQIKGPVTAFVVLKGGMFFASDFLQRFGLAQNRKLQLPFKQQDIRIEHVVCSSYGDDRESAELEGGLVGKTELPHTERAGRTAIILDDVLDTGKTAAWLCGRDFLRGFKGVHFAVACLKPLAQTVEVPKHVTVHWAMVCQREQWLVGYGMDKGQRLRHLGSIWDDAET